MYNTRITRQVRYVSRKIQLYYNGIFIKDYIDYNKDNF